jgi:hypothetical protein
VVHEGAGTLEQRAVPAQDEQQVRIPRVGIVLEVRARELRHDLDGLVLQPRPDLGQGGSDLRLIGIQQDQHPVCHAGHCKRRVTILPGRVWPHSIRVRWSACDGWASCPACDGGGATISPRPRCIHIDSIAI